MLVRCVTELTSRELGYALGGLGEAFGRCGPGDQFQGVLGNIYTPQCKAHDQAVRDWMTKGSSYYAAQVHALPQLPAAVESYVQKRWFG